MDLSKAFDTINYSLLQAKLLTFVHADYSKELQ